MIDKYLVYLRKSSLFKGLSSKEIKTLLSNSGYKFIEMKPGDKYSFKANRYVVVLSGVVVTRVTNINGRIDTLQIYSTNYNSFISDNTRIDVMNMLKYEAKADTVLLELESETFASDDTELAVLRQRFLKNAVRMQSETLSLRDIRTWCDIAPTAREKVLRYIFHISVQQNSDNLVFKETRDEIASYLIIDTSTLLREMRNLKKDGIIDYKGKRVKVLKPDEVIKHSEFRRIKDEEKNTEFFTIK